jgi:hypothetical protein
MGLGQNLLKGDVVRRLLKQREPPDPTVQDMIRKISSCKAGAARHTALVSIPETRVMKRLPTPFIFLDGLQAFAGMYQSSGYKAADTHDFFDWDRGHFCFLKVVRRREGANV